MRMKTIMWLEMELEKEKNMFANTVWWSKVWNGWLGTAERIESQKKKIQKLEKKLVRLKNRHGFRACLRHGCME